MQVIGHGDGIKPQQAGLLFARLPSRQPTRVSGSGNHTAGAGTPKRRGPFGGLRPRARAREPERSERGAPGTTASIRRQADFVKRAGVDRGVFALKGGKNPYNYARAWARLRRRLR